MDKKKFSQACVFLTVAMMGASAAAAEGQERPVVVMYEKVGMTGRSVTYDGPVADIDVRYPFNSAQVLSGEWEVCTRNDFRGACMILNSKVDSLRKELGFFSRVRSARPVQPKVGWQGPVNGGLAEAAENLPLKSEAPAPEAPPQPTAPVSSPPEIVAPTPAPMAAPAPMSSSAPIETSAEAALMGHGAQFFKTPMLGGRAIEADDEEALKAFCREAGLESAAYARAVTVKGRRIVGDLLCESGEEAAR